MWAFLLLSLAGLIVSALAHFSTYFGVDPMEVCPYVWALHIGIFVVFIPAFVIQKQGRTTTTGGTKTEWKDLFPYSPAWINRLVSALFFYAIVNFVVFFVLTIRNAGTPGRAANGTYVLRTKGRNATTRPITAEEYHLLRARMVRGFSGHWMVFYAMAAQAMVSGIRERSSRKHMVFTDERAEPETETAVVNAPAVAHQVLPLEYGSQQRGLPIWLHATLVTGSMIVGWLGGPILTALVVFPRLLPKRGMACLAVPLFFGSAFAFAIIPSTLIKHYVHARCPSCGGRAFLESAKPMRYRCRQCRRDHGL
jgi:hypothetical protein